MLLVGFIVNRRLKHLLLFVPFLLIWEGGCIRQCIEIKTHKEDHNGVDEDEDADEETTTEDEEEE